MSEKKKKAETKKAAKEARKSPDQWCRDLQKFKHGRPPMQDIIPCWQHNAAAALHGWAKHQHEANEPMLLTESNYLAALEAVETSPLKPCAQALSEYMNHKG